MIRNDVLFGKNGYLFLYGGKQKQFSYLMREQQVSNRSKENFYQNIDSRSKFCRDKNIPYIHVVFPSKPLLKYKYLPLGSESVYSIYADFKKMDNVLYPLSVLKELEVYESTFRILDTHMTDSGSNAVAKLIINKLFPRLFDSVSFSEEKKVVQGDLAKMVGLDIRYSEKFLFANCPISNRPFMMRKIDNYDYLSGNNGRIAIQYCVNSLTDKRLLIFGDSFFDLMLHLLSPFFKIVMFIRTPYFFNEIIDVFYPDVVITGNAERYLASIPNDTNSELFFTQECFRTSYQPSKLFLDSFSMQLKYGKYKQSGIYKAWIDNLSASILNEYSNKFIQRKLYDKAIDCLNEAILLKPHNENLIRKLHFCEGMKIPD